MKTDKNNKSNYTLSERLDHIAYMFNVRTAGKAYENFIVNAIYAKVDNPDLMPYTQQCVHSHKDPRKYYLLDLYFRQLDYGVEIDERHHLKEAQKNKDLAREEDVKASIECEEDRIPIFTDDGKKRSYKEMCEDIDRVVKTIQEKIAERGPLKWETNEDRKTVVKTNGIFREDDDVTYSSITEIYNICGGKRIGKDKGQPATKLQKCYYRLNSEYKLWVPTLTIEVKGGTVARGKTKFQNILSEDYDTLEEKSTHPMNPFLDIAYKRVVFMRMLDRFGRPCIKFIGVFKLLQDSNEKHHIYKRIANQVCINDLK